MWKSFKLHVLLKKKQNFIHFAQCVYKLEDILHDWYYYSYTTCTVQEVCAALTSCKVPTMTAVPA